MRIFQWFIFISGLVAGLTWPDSVSAHRPYTPESSIAVKTESLLNDTPQRTEFQNTMIRVLEKNETKIKIGFFPSDRWDVSGILDLDFSGKISWSGVGTAAPTIQAKNLFILSSVTIPADVLPIQKIINTDTPLEYEFYQTAGGRTFFRRIQMVSNHVSRDEARQAGWIFCDDCFDDTDDLQMIVVTDSQSGELVVKQLWAIDGCWWLYEQTPLRRSWRVQ